MTTQNQAVSNLVAVIKTKNSIDIDAAVQQFKADVISGAFTKEHSSKPKTAKVTDPATHSVTATNNSK